MIYWIQSAPRAPFLIGSILSSGKFLDKKSSIISSWTSPCNSTAPCLLWRCSFSICSFCLLIWSWKFFLSFVIDISLSSFTFEIAFSTKDFFCSSSFFSAFFSAFFSIIFALSFNFFNASFSAFSFNFFSISASLFLLAFFSSNVAFFIASAIFLSWSFLAWVF